MADTVHLAINIGPVQSFVAQARRTRDLWAASWLLSYLSETALAAAENAGGHTVIPHRHQPGTVSSKNSPVGGIPNRFELVFDSVDSARQAAGIAIDAFNAAWKSIAGAVWDKYVRHVQNIGNNTQNIWNRQVDNFWEVSWVIGKPRRDTGTILHLTAMRKNIRNVKATGEHGTKCSLMHDLQEISGFSAPGESRKQRQFWSALQKMAGKLDLKETERLCAIALIKRLFPHVIKTGVGLDSSTDLQMVAWPSTAFFAALPWLKSLQGKALELARQYVQIAAEAGFQKSEVKAAQDAGIPWAAIDSPAWFISSLAHVEPDIDPQNVRKLAGHLRNIYEAATAEHHDSKATTDTQSRTPALDSRPVPFYALLLMDGDLMGKILGLFNAPTGPSSCLSNFASEVDATIALYDGRTVYAGGDDLLAILPARNALDAAAALREKYFQAFQHTRAKDHATISAAIVFAHWRFPLRLVIQTAHRLLDDFAKEETGRDAIAIGILLGSGLNGVWAAPWNFVLGKCDSIPPLNELIARFASAENENNLPAMNPSFLYLLREQFSKLLDEPLEKPGKYAHIPFDPKVLENIALAEYRRRLSIQGKNRPESSLDSSRKYISEAMTLSRPWVRCPAPGQDPPYVVKSISSLFSFDGWRIARFVKQILEGKGFDDD